MLICQVCSYMSRFVAKNLQPRQKAWNHATQRRIAAISSMLSTMKVVKMLGYQSSLTSRIQELREEELWAASRLRWVTVYYNMSGMPYILDGDHEIQNLTWYSQRSRDILSGYHAGHFSSHISGSWRQAGYRNRLHHHSHLEYGHTSCKYGHDYCTTGSSRIRWFQKDSNIPASTSLTR